MDENTYRIAKVAGYVLEAVGIGVIAGGVANVFDNVNTQVAMEFFGPLMYITARTIGTDLDRRRESDLKKKVE